MDWCSVYLTPQGLPKYIYLSPPLIFPTTNNGIRTKNRPVWITPGAPPIRWMGPIRNPRWEQKRTEGYVIVSKYRCIRSHILKYKMMLSNSPFFLGLPNNSYKSITNMALVWAWLCKLQKGCTRLATASNKVYQFLAHGRWFSSGTRVFEIHRT